VTHYLELVKFRLYATDDDHTNGLRDGALYTLFWSLLSVLKQLAPVVPYVTEEIFLAAGFAAREGVPSIHVASWPEPDDHWSNADALRDGESVVELAETVRRWKSERQLGAGWR
jgi:valyl-tRNA synthetase